QTGIISLFILRYYIVFKALSFSASLAGIAAVIPMTAISNLINIIPANLAIREAVVSASSMLIGFTPEQGILVAAIDRSVILITLFFTGGWFFIRLRYFDNLILKKNIEGVGAGSDDV
ncbi:MAG: flippase-like domain-containing protein, partial [Candidatus Omnitrophica bacterium]|nr:flippase-like domain-containing protein [Candidatus Omnitrophota bacterium]